MNKWELFKKKKSDKVLTFMILSSPRLHRSRGPPPHQFCNTLSDPVYPAVETCTTPPPGVVRKKLTNVRQEVGISFLY